jgi:hypothetical protein
VLSAHPRTSAAIRKVSLSEGQVSWPATTETYLIEETAGVNAGTWSGVAISPQQIESQFRVLLPLIGNKFYRLRQQ